MKIIKSVKSFTKKIAALVSGPRALSEPLHARCCGLRQRDKKDPARDVTQLLCDNKYHNTMFLQKNLAHMFLRAPPATPTRNWPMSVETLPDTKTIPSLSEPLSKYDQEILDKCLLFSSSRTSPVPVRTSPKNERLTESRAGFLRLKMRLPSGYLFPAYQVILAPTSQKFDPFWTSLLIGVDDKDMNRRLRIHH